MTTVMTRTACMLGAMVAALPALAQQPPDAAVRPAPPRTVQTPRQPRGQGPAGTLRREGPQGQWVESTFTRNLPIGNRNTVELNNVVGNVVINGVTGSSTVAISANRRIMMPNRDAAMAALQKVQPQITQRGGGIEVLTQLPDGVNAPIRVDYDISVPVDTAVSVRMWGGDLRVTNIGGEITADVNGGGDLTLNNVRRVRRAKALVGNVSVSGMDGDELSAETIRGVLQVSNVTAKTIELKSISGAIMLRNAMCDRCTVNSISGSVEMVGPLRPDARLAINTNSGNIRLVPTGPVRFNLELLTTGMKQSEFPLSRRSSEARILRGSFGDDEGSTIVSLGSFTGNITVARQ